MQSAKEIYQNTVSRLTSEERLELAALILKDLTTKANGEARLSVVELINSLPKGRAFQSPAEADEYLRQERDSWDR